MKILNILILIILIVGLWNITIITHSEKYEYEVVEVGGFSERFVGDFEILSVAFFQDEVYVLFYNNNTILYVKNMETMNEKTIQISKDPVTSGDLLVIGNKTVFIALSYTNGTVALYKILNNKIYNIYNSYINPLFNAIFGIKILNNTDIVGYGTTISATNGLDFYIFYISGGLVSWNLTRNQGDRDILSLGAFGDNFFCTASSQGYLVCLTYGGKVVHENIINGRILALDVAGNELYLAYNSGGTIYSESILIPSQIIRWKAELNPIIPSSLIVVNSQEIAFAGLVAINSNYYPAVAFLDNQGRVLVKSKLNIPCKNIFVVYLNKFNNNIGILWKCGNELIFRILTINNIITTTSQLTTTESNTNTTTSPTSTTSNKILGVLNIFAISAALLIIISSIILFKKK